LREGEREREREREREASIELVRCMYIYMYKGTRRDAAKQDGGSEAHAPEAEPNIESERARE
jgi:hypothetical protein